MRRGTTPTITFKVKNKNTTVDLTGFDVYFTVKDQRGTEITFKNDRFIFNEDNSVSITLTQEETLSLHGMAYVQVRAVDQTTNAIATKITTCNFEDIIMEGLI